MNDEKDVVVMNQITQELQSFADKLEKRGLPPAFLVEVEFLHAVTLYMADTGADLGTAVQHFHGVLDKLAEVQDPERRSLQ